MALELNGSTGVSLVQDGVVVTDDLANGAVTAGKLASTLDLTGKTVTLPAGVGGKVLGISSITLDTTSADYSGTPIQLGSAPVWYNSGAQRSVTYTKLSATSVLLVHAAYTFRQSGSGTGSHGLVVFKDSSTYQTLGFDMGRLASVSSTRSAGSGVFPFTGLAAGSHTFSVVAARSNNAGTHSGGINGSGSSDHPTPSATYIYIVEVEV